MKKSTSILREIILILVGAFISGSTAFTTNYLNQKSSESRQRTEKKLEFNQQLAESLGKRLYLTFELARSRRDDDTTRVNAFLILYRQSKEDWNIIRYSYLALVDSYYGSAIRNEYVSDIYNPLVKFGRDAEYQQLDASFEEDYIKLQERTVQFIGSLYNDADN